jgi:hypothetical protein
MSYNWTDQWSLRSINQTGCGSRGHGRLTGHSLDTRRTLTVDNFDTPGGSSSLRLTSEYNAGTWAAGGRQLSRVWFNVANYFLGVESRRQRIRSWE